MNRRGRLLLLTGVIGPGLLAGLSDDDPAGITTYSVLGAEYGYQLLWVLVVSTLALVVFHDLGARLGVVTGQGLVGLVRQRYGVRLAGVAVLALLMANAGTTCAEFAGIAAAGELFGVSRYLSVPVAAVVISAVVLRGSFRRVERVLLAIGLVFLTYVVSGILAHPDWTAAARGLVVPSMPMSRGAIALVTATVGTTLAPWGLSFIQSYAVDKRITPSQLRYERIDVFTGSALTGIIGFFVVVACAATLHETGHSIADAADAAAALEPLAGHLASSLFAVGLLGAAVLAASVLPLSTAYSMSEYVGRDAQLDDRFREAPLFYGTFFTITAIGVLVVLVPGMPLVPLLVATQVVNAVLLLPLLVFLYGIARDRDLMGDHRASRQASLAYVATIAFVGACVLALGLLAAA